MATSVVWPIIAEEVKTVEGWVMGLEEHDAGL